MAVKWSETPTERELRKAATLERKQARLEKQATR